MAKRYSNFKRLKYTREGISFKKSFLLLFILLLQLVVIVTTYIHFVQAFTWIYVISVILSVATSLRVLLRNQNPAAKISWIMFLLIFPTFGYLIYFLAGGSDIHPLHKKRLLKIDEYADNALMHNHFDTLKDDFRENVRYLKTMSNATAYKSSEAKYYKSGEKVLLDILNALKDAKETIYIEFFIIHQGALFNEVLNILEEKDKEGVIIRVLYDGFGSKDLMTSNLKKRLKKTNISFVPFVPIIPLFSFFLNYRDHRKMVIIDGKKAFIGGFNLADEYANIIERFGYWKDSGLSFSGDAVHYFTLAFLKMWMFATKKKEPLPVLKNTYNEPLKKEDAVLVPYVCGPYQEASVARNLYINLLNNARHEISIMTPYFIVDEALLELLKRKVASGVKVNIIIPEIPDKRIVYSLSKALAQRLVDHGCNVYLFKGGFIHSKNVMVDQKVAVIGSVNFDYRSFYQQYENAVYLNDPAVIRELAADFKETMQKGTILGSADRRNKLLYYRLYIALLKWASPLM